MSNKVSRLLLVFSVLIVAVLLSACGGAASMTTEEVYYGDDEGRAVGGVAPAPQAEMDFAEEEAAEEFLVEQSSVAADGIASTNDVQIERVIIRTGYVSIQAEDPLATREAIEQMVAQYAGEGAFIVSINQSGSANSPYINMQIRIPADYFDTAMDDVSGMAAEETTPQRSESAQDVTEEFYDLDNRIESLEAARERLLELMENANTTEDLLLAEQQLTQREAEINSLQGRQNYLAQSARLSSINIDISRYILSTPVDTSWRPMESVRQAFDSLLRSLRGFGDFLIFFIISVLPWLTVFGLVIYGVIRFIISQIRKRQERKAAHSPPVISPDDES